MRAFAQVRRTDASARHRRQRHGRRRRRRAAARARSASGPRTCFTGLLRGRRAARGAGRRRRRRLSVGARDLRPRAARSAPLGHAGHRRRRLRLRRSRRRRWAAAASCRSATRPRWRARSTTCWTGHLNGAPPPLPLRIRVREAFGRRRSCASRSSSCTGNWPRARDGGRQLRRSGAQWCELHSNHDRGDSCPGRRTAHGDHRRRRSKRRRFGRRDWTARGSVRRCGFSRVRAGARPPRSTAGVHAARFPIVCQVDQDVVVQEGWMRRLTEALADPAVAAVQGYYALDRNATWCARAMDRDLEQRYDRDRRSGYRSRVHGQRRLSGGRLAASGHVRRGVRVWVRQRPQLPSARGRISFDLLPRRAQRPSLARRTRGVRRPAVRLRLWTDGRDREASGAYRR